MRWTKSLLASALVAVPLLLNAQTPGQKDAGGATEEVDQPADPASAQPTARKSLMGLVMGALIDSAERKHRQEALSRSETIGVTEPGNRTVSKTSSSRTASPVTEASVAQETGPKESVALQADDIP